MKMQTIVFDLGGVLIDWNPRYLYRKLLKDEAEIEFFLNTICTAEWNGRQDAGRPFREGVALLSQQYPEYAALIEAYEARWEEMLGGAINGTVEILRSVKSGGMPVYALTNWSAETFPIARKHYDFLNWFDGILVSGEVKMRKPDIRIFQLLLERFKLNAGTTLYIDDIVENLKPAQQAGLQPLHFQNAAQLRNALQGMGLTV
jgi:2-haloacid dehalogenase